MEKNKVITLVCIGLFVVFLIGSIIGYQKLKEKFIDSQDQVEENVPTTKEKQKAKDFVIYDEQGNKKSLKDYEGKPIIINTWTTWCGYCELEMPDFDELYVEYKEEITFLMVDVLDGSLETVENGIAYRNKQKYQFPIYFDKDFNLLYQYKLTGYPNTIFIDKEQNVVDIHYGYITKEKLINNINKIKK